MDDQKIENLLNLALDATGEERDKSLVLNTGYDKQTRTWEVIIRYGGDFLERVPENWEVIPLSGGYAIVTLPQAEVEYLAALPQVEYVEKPKRLYFELESARAASCVSPVQTPQAGLLGQGVLVAVIDSGVDYFHSDFRNEDGTTRIAALWDQTAEASEQEVGRANEGAAVNEEEPEQNMTEHLQNQRAGRIPEGFTRGVEYSPEEINRALAAGSRQAGLAIVPEQDLTGHGTQVLGIAAGNGRASGGRYRGIAPESDLIVVKLGSGRAEGFPRTTELMQALEYVMRKAGQLRRPVAINLSFGNAYGSRRGNSLLETYIDRIADMGRSVIVIGTGNEGNAGGHASGRLTMPRAGEEQTEEIPFILDDFETSMNLQIWKNYVDDFDIFLIHPDGRRIGPFTRQNAVARYQIGNQTLLVYYGEPGPYQETQEIFIDFIPKETYLDSGTWRILLVPRQIVTGQYDIWMTDARARGSSTRFLQPSASATMTIPSTASRAIAVGAYDARRNAYASFSGRGWQEGEDTAPVFGVRPDLAAPGVEITTTAPGGGYVSVSGTSFATPFVTGASALLMQWGIVKGNDPYLYANKVRAYLQKGARQLPGFTEWPNNQLGYGALCVRDSLPV